MTAHVLNSINGATAANNISVAEKKKNHNTYCLLKVGHTETNSPVSEIISHLRGK